MSNIFHIIKIGFLDFHIQTELIKNMQTFASAKQSVKRMQAFVDHTEFQTGSHLIPSLNSKGSI